MKAILMENFGGTDQLYLGDAPKPFPEENEILIKILYTSVNPVDWKVRAGLLKNRVPHEFPIILGWDAAGIIEQVGSKVTQFKPGQAVFAYCRKPTIRWGTYAEYVAIPAENAALKPQNISFAEAAAIPLVGLTAWQALFDFAKLKSGEKILIHAGAGGVGSMAIQFAKTAGAFVYTTAGAANEAYVKGLGADAVIDYKRESFVEAIKQQDPKGIDVVFDTLGGQTLRDSFQVLKPQGRLVSLLEQADPKLAEQYQVQVGYVFVSPNGQELQHIARLIEEGRVRPPYIEEMLLEEVAQAQEKVQQGHTRGKIVLRVDQNSNS